MPPVQMPQPQAPVSDLHSNADAVPAPTALPLGSSHRLLHWCKQCRLHWCQQKPDQFRTRKAAAIGWLPRTYLTDVITRIVNGHPNSRIADLLPWAYPAAPALQNVA